MKQFLTIQLILYFGWLSCIAVAQLEIAAAITGSGSLPHVAIVSLANMSVFLTTFIRKRLDIEMAARDFLAIITRPGKMPENTEREQKGKEPDEETGDVKPRNPPRASVLMLTNSAGMTNSSIRQFMQYICNAHHVYSDLHKYDVLKEACEGHSCKCIVISKVDRINIPQVPNELTEPRVLLPSLGCLQNECHGCKGDNLNVEFSEAACEALDFEFRTTTQKDPICICIPVHPASVDNKWTKLLVRMLKYKDQQDRGATVAAADAVQNYLNDPATDRAEETKYKTASLLLIRLLEIFVNLVLTVFFKVDGFTSALAARRAVRSYVVDSKQTGLPANVFLTSALIVVKSKSVCQVLQFRGNIFWLMLLSTFFVNLLCAIAWAFVLIAFNGGSGKWYAVPSMAPSKPRVAVIIAAICIAIGMDCYDLARKRSEIFRKIQEKLERKIGKKSPEKSLKKNWKDISEEIKKDMKVTLILPGVIILEIAFAVVLAVAVSLNNGIERWVYGALHLLVWVKWGIGSSILGAYSIEHVPKIPDRPTDSGPKRVKYTPANWFEEGSLVYSSSFVLNAVMVGVMGDWTGIWNIWK